MAGSSANSPEMANGAGPSQRDVYGFEIDCTAEEQRERESCDKSQAQQVQAWWEKYWKRKKMPKPDKLKKLCRKVSFGSASAFASG